MDCGRKTVETTCAGQTGYIEKRRYIPTQLQGIATPRKAKAQTARYTLITLSACRFGLRIIFYKGSEFMDTGDSSTNAGGRSTCLNYDEFIILNSPKGIGD